MRQGPPLGQRASCLLLATTGWVPEAQCSSAVTLTHSLNVHLAPGDSPMGFCDEVNQHKHVEVRAAFYAMSNKALCL